MTSSKKTKKEKYTFSFVLFSANKPTINGRIYTPELLHQMCKLFTKEKIIIQEMNEVERKVKKISVAEPWMKQVMADVVRGEFIEGELVVHALCRNNREGRKLEGIIKNIGMENLTFFPIGYGDVDDNNVIKPNYHLNYIAIEPKNKAKPT